MKFSLILTPLLLLSEVGAAPGTSLRSAISDAISRANLPGILAAGAEKSKAIIADTIPQATVQSAKWLAANPGTAATYGVLGAGVAVIASPALVAGPGLAAAGFGAQGIVAGSSAAAAQSGIGSVVAPSLFATLQSAGAGGYGVAMVYPAVQVVGGAMTSFAAGTIAWATSRSGPQA